MDIVLDKYGIKGVVYESIQGKYSPNRSENRTLHFLHIFYLKCKTLKYFLGEYTGKRNITDLHVKSMLQVNP